MARLWGLAGWLEPEPPLASRPPREICELQRTFDACERELVWLDVVINTQNSCCIRIGPRNNHVCADITMHETTVYRGRMKFVFLVHTLWRVDNLGVP